MSTQDDLSASFDALKASSEKLIAKGNPPPVAGSWTVEKPISVGVNGKMLFGINAQGAVTPAQGIAKLKAAGFNAVRTFEWSGGHSQPEYWSDPSVAVLLGHPFYGNPNIDQSRTYSTYWANIEKLIPNQWAAEMGNEPGNGSGPHDNDGSVVAKYCRAFKAAFPNRRLAAPALLASYASHPWIDRFFAAKPGLNDKDIWSSHCYYHNNPEDKLMLDVLPTIAYVKSKGFMGEFIDSERGWSTAYSQVIPQRAATSADFGDWKTPAQLMYEYPQDIFRNRGSGLRGIFYFMLKCIPGGGTSNSGPDFQSKFGVYNADWTETQFLPYIRESLSYAVPAIGGANYKRGNTCVTRLDGATSATLALWNVSGASEKIWVSSVGSVAMTVKPIGGAATQIPLQQGVRQVTIPLTAMPCVLSGAGLVFPEFSVNS